MEGLSDREAVDRITFDLRWKYVAGLSRLDYEGFVQTVLVDMRAWLRRSKRPNQSFEIWERREDGRIRLPQRWAAARGSAFRRACPTPAS